MLFVIYFFNSRKSRCCLLSLRSFALRLLSLLVSCLCESVSSLLLPALHFALRSRLRFDRAAAARAVFIINLAERETIARRWSSFHDNAGSERARTWMPPPTAQCTAHTLQSIASSQVSVELNNRSKKHRNSSFKTVIMSLLPLSDVCDSGEFSLPSDLKRDQNQGSDFKSLCCI